MILRADLALSSTLTRYCDFILLILTNRQRRGYVRRRLARFVAPCPASTWSHQRTRTRGRRGHQQRAPEGVEPEKGRRRSQRRGGLASVCTFSVPREPLNMRYVRLCKARRSWAWPQHMLHGLECLTDQVRWRYRILIHNWRHPRALDLFRCGSTSSTHPAPFIPHAIVWSCGSGPIPGCPPGVLGR